MGVFIAVFIVLVLMNGFFFYILKGITVRLGKLSQNNMLYQTGVYDELIRNKEEQLADIQERINTEAKKLQGAQLEGTGNGSASGAADYLAIKNGAYAEEGFAERYRDIRQSFLFDKEQYVREVLRTVSETRTENTARKILERFSPDIRYQLSTMDSGEQAEIIEQFLSKDERGLLHMYLAENDSFACHEFFDWLLELDFKGSTRITVRTGCKEDNFDAIDDRVQTQYDAEICEGIYIIAGGNLYDFSIRNREIS